MPDVGAACARFEQLGVEFVKKPNEGKMRCVSGRASARLRACAPGEGSQGAVGPARVERAWPAAR